MRKIPIVVKMSLIVLCGYPKQSPAAESFGPYTATVVRVIDGDTVELDVHLWPGLVKRIKLRLAGVNTPEKRGKGASLCEKVAARRATDFTRGFMKWTKTVIVSEVRLGK